MRRPGLRGMFFFLGLTLTALGQRSILPAGPEDQGNLQRPSAQHASITRSTFQGEAFRRAIRVVTQIEPTNPWNVQFNIPMRGSVVQGDVLLATFYHRLIDSVGGEGFATFIFERASPPWIKSANRTITIASSEWTKTEIAFEALESYSPGLAQVNFQLGHEPQTIEIGGIEVLNYGKLKSLDELMSEIDSGPAYPGQEPEALWRQEAVERIEAIRKSDICVTVVDGLNKPIVGAAVRIRMKRHAYAFGSAVAAPRLLERSEDADRYRQVIVDSFNRVVIENNLKWPAFENERRRGINAVNWLLANNLEVRGHTVVWPGWSRVPKDVPALAARPPLLQQRINDRIVDVTREFAGKLVDWDVVNEPFTERDILDVFGDDEMIAWFDLAKENDPTAQLYLNDFGILAGTGTSSPHQDYYFETIKRLLEAGAPLEGIGMQGHVSGNLTSPNNLWRVLERFSEFNLPIQVTEFDVQALTPEIQADYLRDFMTLVFSHPKTVGIVMWGFWERNHWRPDAALFNADWSLRPHGEMWYQLVHGDWWTDETWMSDENGKIILRGFHGDYEIIVETETQSQSIEAKVGKSGLSTLEQLNEAAVRFSSGAVTFADGKLRIGLEGSETTGLKVETSADLREWRAAESALVPHQATLEIDVDMAMGSRFFRLRSN